MSTLKVDTIATRTGSGNITVSNNIAGGGTISGTNITASGTLGVTGNTTLSGTAAITGNTTVGGTLTNTGLITASGGVAIGGTGSANTLDDYEIGDYSPSYRGSSAAGSSSYSYRHGSYVKIGNYCQVWIDITLSSSSGMSGTPQLTLPFAAVNAAPLTNNSSTHMGNFWWWSVDNNYMGSNTPSAWINGGSDYCTVYKTNGFAAGHTPASMNTTGRIAVAVGYFVA